MINKIRRDEIRELLNALRSKPLTDGDVNKFCDLLEEWVAAAAKEVNRREIAAEYAKKLSTDIDNIIYTLNQMKTSISEECSSKSVKSAPSGEEDSEEEVDLDECEQCGESAWDGYICHNCGLKNI